jgi:hypothetical protein
MCYPLIGEVALYVDVDTRLLQMSYSVFHDIYEPSFEADASAMLWRWQTEMGTLLEPREELWAPPDRYVLACFLIPINSREFNVLSPYRRSSTVRRCRHATFANVLQRVPWHLRTVVWSRYLGFSGCVSHNCLFEQGNAWQAISISVPTFRNWHILNHLNTSALHLIQL